MNQFYWNWSLKKDLKIFFCSDFELFYVSEKDVMSQNIITISFVNISVNINIKIVAIQIFFELLRIRHYTVFKMLIDSHWLKNNKKLISIIHNVFQIFKQKLCTFFTIQLHILFNHFNKQKYTYCVKWHTSDIKVILT